MLLQSHDPAAEAIARAATQAAAASGGDAFLPHGYCFLWNKPLLWTHVLADILIGLSYVTIAFTLALFVHRMRRDIPFSVVFVAFGTFIIACGMTHFVEVWTFWQPVYWTAGAVKVVTAVASVSTAAVLPFVVPRAQATVHEARLSREREVSAARTAALEESNAELERLNAELRVTAAAAEAAREAAERANASKARFLAVMSHELRTPLNAIGGYTDLLAACVAGPVTAGQEQYLDRIKGSAGHLARVIEGILDFARLDAGKESVALDIVDAGAIARDALEVVRPLASDKGIALHAALPAGRTLAYADARLLKQVLLNLLANGIKYTAAGEVRLSVRAGADRVQLEVADTGPGIAAEHLPHIFDAFYQAEPAHTRAADGTGLGLSIVREHVALLGGEVTVESEVGRGTRFRVSIPARPVVVPPAGAELLG